MDQGSLLHSDASQSSHTIDLIYVSFTNTLNIYMYIMLVWQRVDDIIAADAPKSQDKRSKHDMGCEMVTCNK